MKNEELIKGDDENERGQQVYRKLLYFYTNKIPVHFKLASGVGWKNGTIFDLSEKKLTFVLIEIKEGAIPFLCEEILMESIVRYISPEEIGEYENVNRKTIE